MNEITTLGKEMIVQRLVLGRPLSAIDALRCMGDVHRQLLEKIPNQNRLVT